MDELQDYLGMVSFFTKFDLKNGCYLLRMRRSDVWKTAIRTRHRLYEYIVMPFGLYNAPSIFQRMLNTVLHDLLEEGVIAYFDDMMRYSELEEYNTRLVEMVLQKLMKLNFVSVPRSLASTSPR